MSNNNQMSDAFPMKEGWPVAVTVEVKKVPLPQKQHNDWCELRYVLQSDGARHDSKQ